MEEQGKSRRPRSKRLAATPRVTMTDVARAAGCSQATVSFVLNHATGVKISEEMRSRVLQVARELGYGTPGTGARQGAPSPAARSIGFIVDQLATSPESVNAIDGARQAVWADGTVILAAQTMNDPDAEERVVQTMLRSGVAGLVYMAIFTRKVSLPEFMYALPVPVVLSNCFTEDRTFPSVVPDEVTGGRLATEELLKAGHRRIAIITGEPWMDAARDRLKGYAEALHRVGLAVEHALVEQGNWSPTSGFEATQRLLSLKTPPTAIFCQNDKMASGCYDAIKDAGLKVPHDISVIGYDDDELCRHLRPQLSSMILPHRAMGAWAAGQLNQARKWDGSRHPIVAMECGLVKRASVATRS